MYYKCIGLRWLSPPRGAGWKPRGCPPLGLRRVSLQAASGVVHRLPWTWHYLPHDNLMVRHAYDAKVRGNVAITSHDNLMVRHLRCDSSRQQRNRACQPLRIGSLRELDHVLANFELRWLYGWRHIVSTTVLDKELRLPLRTTQSGRFNPTIAQGQCSRRRSHQQSS